MRIFGEPVKKEIKSAIKNLKNASKIAKEPHPNEIYNECIRNIMDLESILNDLNDSNKRGEITKKLGDVHDDIVKLIEHPKLKQGLDLSIPSATDLKIKLVKALGSVKRAYQNF